MFGIASKKELPDVYEEMEKTMSPADAVTIVFHPTAKEVLLIYTKTGTPVSSGERMVFGSLDTAITFLRGLVPAVSSTTPTKNSSENFEPKQEIGFLAKAA